MSNYKKVNERRYKLYDQLTDIIKHSIGEKILSSIQRRRG